MEHWHNGKRYELQVPHWLEIPIQILLFLVILALPWFDFVSDNDKVSSGTKMVFFSVFWFLRILLWATLLFFILNPLSKHG